MSYLSRKLLEVGIEPASIRSVIEQALELDTKEALETAISCSITGISWWMQQQGASEIDKQEAVKSLLETEPFKKARERLKELR